MGTTLASERGHVKGHVQRTQPLRAQNTRTDHPSRHLVFVAAGNEEGLLSEPFVFQNSARLGPTPAAENWAATDCARRKRPTADRADRCAAGAADRSGRHRRLRRRGSPRRKSRRARRRRRFRRSQESERPTDSSERAAATAEQAAAHLTGPSDGVGDVAVDAITWAGGSWVFNSAVSTGVADALRVGCSLRIVRGPSGAFFGLSGHLLMAPRRDFVRADLNRLRLRRQLQVALQVFVDSGRVRLGFAARERHDRSRSERQRHEFPHHSPPGRDDFARRARDSRMLTMAHHAPLVNWQYGNLVPDRRPMRRTRASE